MVLVCRTYDFFVNNQQYKTDIFLNTHLVYFKSQLSKNYEERNSLIYPLIITYYKMNVSHTQLVISSRLKHKVDKYVRYVNIVNDVLITKTSRWITQCQEKQWSWSTVQQKVQFSSHAFNSFLMVVYENVFFKV